MVIKDCQKVVNQSVTSTDSLCRLPPKSLYLAFCDCLRTWEIKPGKVNMSKRETQTSKRWRILESISNSGVNEIGFPTLTTPPTCVSYKKRFR